MTSTEKFYLINCHRLIMHKESYMKYSLKKYNIFQTISIYYNRLN